MRKKEYLLDGNSSLEDQERTLSATEKQYWILVGLGIDDARKADKKNRASFEEAPLGRLAEMHLASVPNGEDAQKIAEAECGTGKKPEVILTTIMFVGGEETNVVAFRCS